ncbi:MAG TPA: pyridoxamine 5'-phosphate oxidase family protein [Acidimicrobiales bacterium]|nr:pyridoxamine 5'-phosphate oxidase family protein [Acidimicrobiales bacterium]
MNDPSSHAAFLELDRAECERLLASRQVGRLAVVIDGAPQIVPVNYATPGGAVIVFRTAAGTVITEASLRAVAFEVDEVDVATHSGWSVEVRGFGRDIGDALDSESVRLRQLPVVAWVPGDRQQWFKIVPDVVTGRRLTPA